MPAILGFAGALLIVVMALFQAYDILRRLEIVLETEQHRLLNLARAIAEQTANSLQTVDTVLRTVAAEQSQVLHRPERGGSPERLQIHLNGIAQVADLLIAGPDGQLLGHAGSTAGAGRPARSEWFLAHVQGGDAGLYVSKPFLEPEHGRWTVALSRRISARDGAFAGVVIAHLDLQHFQRLYGALDVGPGSAVSLLRVEGDPVVRFPGDDTDARAEASVLRELAGDDRGAARLVTLGADGSERICAAQLVPGFPLLVGISAERSAVLAPWYVQVMHSTVRTTLLCLSVALLTWLALRQLGRRERAEQSLRVQTALLDELFESAPEAIVLLDRDQRVMRVNREFVTMFGFAPEEAAGRRLEGLIVPVELRDPGARPGDAAARRIASETERMRKDGGRLQVSMLAAPIDTTEGLIASYAIFRDITERRLAEVERSKLELRLRQAEKLEAIGTMAGGIAHDFGNILTAMLNYGEVALSASAEDERVRRAIERMMAGAQRARALVTQILTYSRSTRGKRALIRICYAVDEALLLVRAALPGNVDLQMRLSAADARVVADSTQIHQLVMNLSTNAIQAMPQGGTLEVTLDPHELPADIELSHGLLHTGRYARLAVSDTGCGIDPDTLARIFEPFFTTKPAGAGTGLGLATVHAIVTEVGGAIDVCSRVGTGSTFTVYLPCAETGEGDSLQAHVALPRGRGERVLLVEDERPLMLLAEEMLAALSFEPAGFSRAREALAEFQRLPQQFDLLIVDHLMPDMTGIELSRAIRRLGSLVPIILCSGYTGPLLIQDALAAGIDRILTKPLDLESLAQTIASVRANARAH